MGYTWALEELRTLGPCTWYLVKCTRTYTSLGLGY